MRAGFLGEQMYYEVKALRGTRIAILHSSYVKNVSNSVVPIVPSLVSIAVTSFAPDVPPGTLPAASSHVFPPPPPPPPPPPSVSDGNTVGTRTGIHGSRLRSGRSPTSNVQLASGDAAAARDSRGFLLCEHQKRLFNCSLCLETNKIAQQSKSGSTVVTRDITLATSPASTTGPGSSSTHTPETTVGVTSGVTGRMLGKRQRSPPVIEEPPPKATSVASGPAFCTRAGTDVTGGATSGVTVKDQHRDKWQPPPKVSPRIKAPPLKPPPSPLHPHSPHAQVLMVNLHSPVHQVVDTRALPTIAPALRRTNLRVVPVVERVQFRKASKTIATRSIGQKYASTKSVRPGARYASKR